MSHQPVPSRAVPATSGPRPAHRRRAASTRGGRTVPPGRRPGPAAAARALTLVLGVLALVTAHASAQSFDANRYYQQCLRFEAGGDLETARQACLNALQIDPGLADAEVALGRIELGLGLTGSAEQRLMSVKDKTTSAEPLVLLAQIAVDQGRYLEAESDIQEARSRLDKQPNRQLAAKTNYIDGRLNERRGRYNQALASYNSAIDQDGLNVHYRLAEARLRFRLGDPAAARAQLEAYMKLSSDTRNADVYSLLGTTLWSTGDLSGAVTDLEKALSYRSSSDTNAQASDLTKLALIYYAQGDVQSGGLALREATRRGNLQHLLVSNGLVWLLVLLVLVGAHLVGESRIANATTLEVVEGPQEWTVGQAYGMLVVSLLMAALTALVYSVAVYKNALAFATPLQDTQVRAVFLIALAVLLLVLTWRRVAMHGWDAYERLLGSGEQAATGIFLGIVLLAAVLGYMAYAPRGGLLGPFYLNLTTLTPLVVAAMVLLPFTELFFRAFLIPPLQRRYDAGIATVASASLYGLVLGTPVLLLLVLGVVLAELFRRRSNGITPLLAQLVVNVGLVLAVAFSVWARSLFLN